MKRFVDGVDRSQGLLLPDRLEDYVHEDNPVRVVDAFVEALDLSELGFEAVDRAAGGRPAYHPEPPRESRRLVGVSHAAMAS